MSATQTAEVTARRARSGWSPEETDDLFARAKEAGREGRPIRSVFDDVAQATGRKPNSIRNYYYLKLKESGREVKSAFVPFGEEEVDSLLRFMLLGQAKGRSVRSLAFELGGGDQKQMLRYQNKYRSVLRSCPAQVCRVMESLKQEGKAYVDPFVKREQKQQRRRQEDSGRLAQALAFELGHAGEEGEALARAMLALLRRGDEGEEPRAEEGFAIRLGRQVEENSRLQQRLSTLEALNRGFLTLSPEGRVAGVEEYAQAIFRFLSEPVGDARS
ncbi:MAG: hypothetical protein IJP03_03840 [Christensenellaceae bacterium]|nr:hypothetical protein [Christensenellaceae bacterium]